MFEGKKLGRKKALETIISQLTGLEEQVAAETSKLEQLRAQNLKEELSELEAKLRISFSQSNEIKQSRAKLETELKLKKDRLESIVIQVNQLNDQLSATNAQVDELANKILDIKNQLNDTEQHPASDGEAMEALELELAKASNDYNSAQIELIKQEGNYNASLTELEFTESQLNENKLSLEEDLTSLKVSKEVIEEAQDKVKIIQAELEVKYEEKAEKEKSLNAEESKYFGIRNEIGEKENVIRQLNRQLQQLQTEINNKKDKFHGMKLELNSISERLNIEFDIQIEALEDVVIDPDTDDLKELKESVDKLRKRISNYGEVNPMAVVTFNEIKERYDEMIVQRDDVLKAKESLLETISEIQQ